jgi:hypothetical protein
MEVLRTAFFALLSPGLFVQMLSLRQSSDTGLLFCAVKFFNIRRPDSRVKFGKLTGDLLDGQSADCTLQHILVRSTLRIAYPF